MTKIQQTQQQQTSQPHSTRDFRQAQRAYEKKRQKYALGKQSDAQVAEIAEHNRKLADLQKQFGAAQGDDTKLAELKQAYADEQTRHKDTMSKTADIKQYYKGFDEEAYDKQQTEREAAGQNSDSGNKKSFGQTVNDTENKQSSEQKTIQPKDIVDSNNEQSGGLSTALSTSLSNYLQKQAFGDSPRAPNSEHLRNQAEMHDKQAGDEQKNTQQNFQVANRNYRVEAEKNAASQAAAENSQKVHNLGNASAGAAALERDVKSADYNTHMQRQDQQRAEGVKNQREMWGARQTAEEERADANKEDHDYLDTNIYNNISDSLSRGGIPDNGLSTASTQQASEQPSETIESEQPSETVEESEPEVNGGNLHVVMNYIQGSTKDVDKYNSPEIQALIKKYNVAPLPKEKQTFNHAADAEVARLYPEFMQAYNKATGRNVATKNQEDARNESDIQRYVNSAEVQNDTPSDMRQKNIVTALSSIRF